MKMPKRSVWLGITAIALYVIGLSGVPGDVQTWLNWIDAGLKLMNHDIARWLFVVLASASVVLIFYPPNIRRQIADRFRCARIASLIRVDAPMSGAGWATLSGEPEPDATLVSIPVGGPQVSLRTKHITNMEAEPSEVLPSARYIQFRGILSPINTDPNPFSAFSYGVTFVVYLKFRTRQDGREVRARLHCERNMGTYQAVGSHDWMVRIEPYRDSSHQDVITIDLKPILRDYRPNEYEFLGVSGVQMRLASATLDNIKILRPSTWKDWWKAAFDMKTWIPWQ